MTPSRWPALLAMLACVSIAAAAPASSQAQPVQKPRITRAGELPAFSYPATGDMEAFVRAPLGAPARALRAALRRDIDSILRTYDIADAGLIRSLDGTLLYIAMLDDRFDDAERLIAERRRLSPKAGVRLMTGLEPRAMIEARRVDPDVGSTAYASAVARILLASLRALPFDSVANELREAKSGIAYYSEGMVIGPVRSELQPVVDREHAMTLAFARKVVSAMFSLRFEVPIRATLYSAYNSVLAGRTNTAKPDIWKARHVVLASADGLTPVLVGVWDSGLDTTMFADRLARDARGRALVMGFDRHIDPQNTPMATLSPALLSRQEEMSRLFRGFGDMDANIESPDAKYTRDRIASLSPDSAAVYEDWQEQWNGYSHGTAVASVAVADNPAARIVLGRMEFTHAAIPDPCPSRVNADREAAMLARMVAFFRLHHARVVNMSWGRPESGFLGELERCAPSLKAGERAAIAHYAVDTLRRAMIAGMRASPDILFVASSGNAGSNTEFNDSALRIDLPNMLLVGAVDRAGDEASFTNTGPLVRLYANGYLVETRVPGNGRELSSGTSFAAPAVANTVSKMLAVQPTLTTATIVDILLRTADVRGAKRLPLLNPAMAVAEARLRTPARRD